MRKYIGRRSMGSSGNKVLDNENDEKQQQKLPMFPRIHVKDRDEGGPKAPPRNKMAVCEQLIPATSTQRITGSSAAPILPLPPPKCSALAPAEPSPNYVGNQEISTSIVATPSGPAASADQRLHLYSYNAVKMNFPKTSHEQGSMQLPQFPAGMKPAEYVNRNGTDKNNPYSDLKMFQQIHMRPQNGGNQEFPKSVERFAEGYCRRDVLASGTLMRPPKNVKHIAATEPFTKAPHVDDMRGPAVGVASCSRPRMDYEYMLPESQYVGKNKVGRSEVSATSSVCNVNISPGDIIAVIGEEAFLKLRNEMIRHQREFAAQVFELHRLITAQRLVAQSLKQAAMDKQVNPSSKSQNLQELQRGYSSERQDGSSRTKSSPESTIEMLQLLPHEKNLLKVPPKPGQETSARNQSKPAFVNPDSKANTRWSYPQPPPATANHWLVPVMSPSEGLIYKPYPILSAPSPAAIPPGYGSCQPFPINPAKTVTTVSGSQQPGIRPNFIDIPPYFPPYVTPSVNTVTSTAPSEHAGKAVCTNPKNFTLTTESSFRSSWNFSSQLTATASHSIDHAALLAAKESAYQDSTASSSPPEASQENVLPLFPLEPTEIGMLNKQRKVIKVVLRHDPKSAAESAARIFQSIQEERKW